MLYVCVRDVMDVVFSVCIVRRGAVGAQCSCMGNMSVSSCRCCMFVSCVYPVAVLKSCVLHDLLLVNDGRGCKRRPYGRGILQSRSHDCLVGSHGCLLLFTSSCCGECFYYL